MKKPIIIAIFGLAAIIGVVVVIKMSGTNDLSPKDGGTAVEETQDESAKAAEIGEGEVKFTAANFQKEVRDYKGVAMVDMYSPTCPHCQKMGPVISEIAKETQGKYKVGKLDANNRDNLDVVKEFDISSVPAFIIFKDGKEVNRLVGEQSKDVLLNALAEAAK